MALGICCNRYLGWYKVNSEVFFLFFFYQSQLYLQSRGRKIIVLVRKVKVKLLYYLRIKIGLNFYCLLTQQK